MEWTPKCQFSKVRRKEIKSKATFWTSYSETNHGLHSMINSTRAQGVLNKTMNKVNWEIYFSKLLTSHVRFYNFFYFKNSRLTNCAKM